MTVFWLTLAVFALFFILMSVRLIFIKGGEFRGTCASQSPWLNKDGVTCGYCGKTLNSGDAACGDPDGSRKLEGLPKIKN
jgi:hypothetical protein